MWYLMKHRLMTLPSVPFVRRHVNIGSGKGLSPVRCQAFTWPNDDLTSVRPSKINFNDISDKIQTFSFNIMHLKISAKWQSICLGLIVWKLSSYLQYWILIVVLRQFSTFYLHNRILFSYIPEESQPRPSSFAILTLFCLKDSALKQLIMLSHHLYYHWLLNPLHAKFIFNEINTCIVYLFASSVIPCHWNSPEKWSSPL